MTRPVLIIEDEPDIAEGLRYNLEREGLPAISASATASSAARRKPPAKPNVINAGST